ncbi:MAG: hypothetical protein NT114_00510 [Patescibacteria group bacterium]|nr:hypothetical protein [Patescibacteria group bacterium]
MKSKFKKMINKPIFWFGICLLIVIASIASFMWSNTRGDTLATASRELQSFATTANLELPDDNQIDIIKVNYVDNFRSRMEVDYTQGNTRCHLPVEPPADNKSLYSVSGVDALDTSMAGSTAYKCMRSDSNAGLG